MGNNAVFFEWHMFNKDQWYCTVMFRTRLELWPMLGIPRLRNHNATDDGNVDFRSF